ncbi:hypothetical protein GOBAR_AA11698 [Gossypium barbadense]|uniref:Uncharacterized protein n=1 Tax=Gossypium barbadense TaxID=3634 RepID=A0A2P5Y044_GOSBA|nr:hypothetical protein GOBAR_AA11698 [Gossypium barbadense]
MELLDDNDVETMVALYCLLGVEDFSDPGLDDVPDNIDKKRLDGANDHAPSVRNLSHGIIIRNDPGAHISVVNPDAVHVSKFPSTWTSYLIT